VESVVVDLPNKEVMVRSSLTQEEILAAIRRTGKAAEPLVE
jgi:hypothetical protein